jgi:hypothetical protein
LDWQQRLTTNWSTAGNWSALPTAADDVKFYDGGNTNAAGVGEQCRGRRF